jgi:hypothetical protein
VSFVLAPHCGLQLRLAAGELLHGPRHAIHVRQCSVTLRALESCYILAWQGCFAADLANGILVAFPAKGSELLVRFKEWAGTPT